MSKLLTPKDAGERLGVSAQRVRTLIYSKRLPAVKMGNTWIINEDDLVLVKERTSGWKLGRSRTRMHGEDTISSE